MERQHAFDTWLDHVAKGMGQCRRRNSCIYYEEVTGNMCAIGSLMDHPEKYARYVGNVHDLLSEEPELRREAWSELDAPIGNEWYSFLSELQEFHDEEANWNGVELDEHALDKFKQEWGLE